MGRNRRLLLTVALTIGVVPAAQAQAATGNMNLHLGVPAGVTLGETSLRVDNASTGYSGLVIFSAGSGPFMVTSLPVASGYAANVTSAVVGGGTCTGSNAGFPIFENGTTIVFVNLTCQLPPPAPVPALGRSAPLLLLSLALLGVFAIRRRGHDGAGHGPSPMFGVHRRQP